MATKEKNIQQEIINAAGQIYNYLSDKGEVSINKMTWKVSLPGHFFI